MPLSSRTPCSRALSCSLAATPPITRRSLQMQTNSSTLAMQQSPPAGTDYNCRLLCICTFMLSRVDSHLSLGLSTYFLNCLTLLRVCSASSLEGSMISALGPLDVSSWLTLALPAQTEQRKLLNKYWYTDNKECSNTVQISTPPTPLPPKKKVI